MSIEQLIQSRFEKVGIPCSIIEQGHMPKAKVNGSDKYGKERHAVLRNLKETGEQAVAEAMYAHILYLRKNQKGTVTIRRVELHEFPDGHAAATSVSFIS